MRVFLETEQLVLRPFTDADADGLFALDNDPDVMRFINGGRPVSREAIHTQTLPRLLHDYPCFGTRGYWAAEEKTTGAFLGWFEFRPLDEHSPAVVELGYRLNKAAWGNGYATAGSRGLDQQRLHRPRGGAGHREHDGRERTVPARMEKAGMSFLRHFTGDWPEAIAGSEHGEVEYDLARTDWEQRR